MISISNSGSFDNLEKFLKRAENNDISSRLNDYGRQGVAALASATPVDSGLTADSWGYRITQDRRGPTVEWYNTNADVAIMIQYGHGTGTGGYVSGRDYINPAMRPLFDEIANKIWKEVVG